MSLPEPIEPARDPERVHRVRPQEPDEIPRRARLPVHSLLRSAAIALSAPCIFYGVLGIGSTFIVWAMIEFNALRPDFYLSIFAAAGPAAFLIRLTGLRVGWRVPPAWLCIALNLACIAFALLLAVLRQEHLRSPVLIGVLALLVVGPALNAAVLLREQRAQ